jgi:hypothetical protein
MGYNFSNSIDVSVKVSNKTGYINLSMSVSVTMIQQPENQLAGKRKTNRGMQSSTKYHL